MTVPEWLEEALTREMLVDLVGRVASIALIWVVAIVAIRVLSLSLDRFFAGERSRRLHVRPERAATLNTLLKSVARYAVYFTAGVMILERLGVPTGSILATAGIGGLAVGFGAQNLVRDVITGFFILFEDQYKVGDYVEVAGVEGIVEELGLRTTKIRDFGGQLHIIPNGLVSQVTNFMGDSMRVMFDVPIAYEADIKKAVGALEDAFAEISSQDPDIVQGPEVLGVQELADSGVSLRIYARSKPMQQWAVERRIRQRIKEAFDANGIEIPYPRRKVIIQAQKDEGNGGKNDLGVSDPVS